MTSCQTARSLSISQKGIFCKINANCVKRFMVNIKQENSGQAQIKIEDNDTYSHILIYKIKVQCSMFGIKLWLKYFGKINCMNECIFEIFGEKM